MSFHAGIEKALATYGMRHGDVLFVLENGEQAIADDARQSVFTIVGKIQSEIANDEKQNQRWAVVVELADGDAFVLTVHPFD